MTNYLLSLPLERCLELVNIIFYASVLLMPVIAVIVGFCLENRYKKTAAVWVSLYIAVFYLPFTSLETTTQIRNQVKQWNYQGYRVTMDKFNLFDLEAEDICEETLYKKMEVSDDLSKMVSEKTLTPCFKKVASIVCDGKRNSLERCLEKIKNNLSLVVKSSQQGDELVVIN